MTADLARERWRAARDAGSGLFPWELRVRKNFSAISFSVCHKEKGDCACYVC